MLRFRSEAPRAARVLALAALAAFLPPLLGVQPLSTARAASETFLLHSGAPGEGLYPTLRLQLTDGTRIPVPYERTRAVEILEAVPDAARVADTLAVDDIPGGRNVALLGFDVVGTLAALDPPRSADDIASADLTLYTVARRKPAPGRDYVFEGRITLHRPPADTTWRAPDGDVDALVVNYRDAGAPPNGVQPAPNPPAYPVETQLASLTRTADWVEPDDLWDSAEGRYFSAALRFKSLALTDHVQRELQAGQPPRFIVYIDRRLGQLDALDSGPWPSSRAVDAGDSGLARAEVSGPLDLTGARPLPAGSPGVGPTVVGSGDLLTVALGSRLLTYDTEANLVAEATFAQALETDAASVEALHLLADGSVVVTYLIGNVVFAARLAGQDQLGDVLSRVEVAQGGVSMVPYDVTSTISPKSGTLFVLTRVLDVYDTQTYGLFEVGLATDDELLAQGLDPASARVLEQPLPEDYRPGARGLAEERLLSPPLFDREGRLYLVWSTRDPATLEVGLRVDIRAANGNTLKSVAHPGVRVRGAVVSPVGPARLHIVGKVGGGFVAVTVDAERPQNDDAPPVALDGVTGTIAADPDRNAPLIVGADGRIFVRQTRPIIISRAGDTVRAGTELSVTPTWAMTNGWFVGGATGAGFLGAKYLVEPDGIAANKGIALAHNAFLFPSSRGLFAFTDGELRHYGPADRFLLADVRRRITLPACVAEPCPEALLRARPSLSDYETNAALDELKVEWIPAGVRSGGTVAACRANKKELCFVASAQPSVMANRLEPFLRLEDSFSTKTPPIPRPGSEHLWTTTAAVRVVGGQPAGLEMSPGPVTQIYEDETQRLTVTRASGAVPNMRWEVLRGRGYLAQAIDGRTAASVTVIPDIHASNVTVELVATEVFPDGTSGASVFATVRIDGRPRLSRLDRNPNPDRSVVREGGTAYRYYRLLSGPPETAFDSYAPEPQRDERFEFPDLEAVFLVSGTSNTVTARGLRDAPPTHLLPLTALDERVDGLLAVAIPWDALQGTQPATAGTVRELTLQYFVDPASQRIFEPLPEHRLRFEVAVEARGVERSLEYSRGLIIGAGLFRYTQGGRGAITTKGAVRDGAFEVDSVGVDFTQTAGLGLTAQLFDFSLVGPKNGPGVSVGLESKLYARGAYGEAFAFDDPDQDVDLQDLLALRVAIAAGLLTTPPGADPVRDLLWTADLLSVAQADLARLEAHRVYTAKSIVAEGVAVDLSANAQLYRNGDEGGDLYVEFSLVNIAADAAVTKLALGPEGKAGAIGRFEVGGQLELAKFNFFGVDLCPKVSWVNPETKELEAGPYKSCKTRRTVEEVEVGGDGKLIAVRASIVDEDDALKTWTVEGRRAHGMLRRSGNLRALGVLAGCRNCPGLFSGSGGIRIAGSVIADGTFIPAELIRKASWTQSLPQRDESPFVAGISGLGVGAKASINKVLFQDSTRLAGVLVGGGGFPPAEFPLEAYNAPDAFVPEAPKEVPDDLNIADRVLRVNKRLADKLGDVFQEKRESFGAGLRRQIQRLATGMAPLRRAVTGGLGFSVALDGLDQQEVRLDAAFEQPTELVLQAWPRVVDAAPTRDDVGATVASELAAVIGGYHRFSSEGPTVAQGPATLGLGYAVGAGLRGRGPAGPPRERAAARALGRRGRPLGSPGECGRRGGGGGERHPEWGHRGHLRGHLSGGRGVSDDPGRRAGRRRGAGLVGGLGPP